MNLEQIKEYFKDCTSFKCAVSGDVWDRYIESNIYEDVYIGYNSYSIYANNRSYFLYDGQERKLALIIEPGPVLDKDQIAAVKQIVKEMLKEEESELVPYTRREYEWRWVMKDCRDEMYISNAYFSQKYVGLVDSTIFVQKIESTKRIKKS